MRFSRKNRWPEHYFSVWCLGNSQKLLTTNQFLFSTICFTIINISFFNLYFDLYLINTKEVNQIRNNVVCVVVRLVVSPCIDLYFLCEYLLYLSVINFTPIIRVFVIEKQSLVKLICIWYKQIEKRTGMSHPLRQRRRPFWANLVLAQISWVRK